jgi:hypothetical protein
VKGTAGSGELACAELAVLSMLPLEGLRTGENAVFRARIPLSPPPAVPLWVWVVEHVATGRRLEVRAIDEGWTTAAARLVDPGAYRIAAHTIHPPTKVCGVEVRADVVR